MTTHLTDLQLHWTPIAPILSLRDEQEYEAAIARLNSLVDEIGSNQEHPLYTLLDTLGTLVHTYEEQHHPIAGSTSSEVLQFLMEEHSLTATDLPEIGPPDVVERYLAGKHEISVNQVRVLAERFHVSPAVFV